MATMVAVAIGCAGSAPSRAPAAVRVTITTEIGLIVAELYPDRAPETVANFLRYVDTLAYDGGSFFRTVREDNQPEDQVRIAVVQAAADSGRNSDFPPIAIETTALTGLRHLDGTLSMARNDPHSARASFFICLGDQPELDFGGRRNPDGQGFAAFGRVVEGMEVLRRIQASPATGQALTPPIAILRIERSTAPAEPAAGPR
ncbi:MAG: peptidylprolyl isomerase [Gemmatimonadota bacterium]